MKYVSLVFLMVVYWGVKAQPIIELRPFTTESIGQVVGIISSGDERLFAVVQSGIIRIVRADGSIDSEPFLDIRGRVQSGGERGLLGLAFHPEYPENPTFYLNYTRPGNATVISRWKVSDDNMDLADIDSEEILMVIEQPFANHNGGDVRFGPDGFLYIGMGDGGSGNDPQNLSQNRQSFHGKMLRLDVNTDEGYLIPADNPFAMDDETLDEVWALGLRNPWRFSFDRLTGDIWIADVGQNAIEEVNKQAADSKGGENYGWRCFEGTRPNITTGCQSADAYVFPIFEYNHSQGDRSITGGFVYRGDDFPAMHGRYVFADFVSSRFFNIWETEEGIESEVLGILGVASPSTFGEDHRGELYVASYFSGTLHRVVDFCQSFFPSLELDSLSMELSVVLASADWNNDLSIEWFLNGESIEGASEPRLLLEENGDYFAIVTHSRGCTFSTDTIEYITTSTVESHWPSEIKLSPNPFGSELFVSSLLNETFTFELIDSRGSVLEQGIVPAFGQFRVQTDLPKGWYVCRVITSNGAHYTQKVLRQ